MSELIKSSIDKGLTYDNYCILMNLLVAEDKTTGVEQTDERISFTRLNASRMRRLDKTIALTEPDIKLFEEIQEKQTWLIISESWCADGAQTIPVLNKIAEVIPNINLKIVLRDENIELMNCFLTSGNQSIPKLIIVNENNDVIYSWGSRSKAATELVQAYKSKFGIIDATFKKDLQIWYNKDKGRAIINELLELLGVKQPS